MFFYLFWLSFLIFSGYFLTLCPTFYFGDSPELSAAVACLGVPHPPGYPLWILLARLFLLFPLGNLASRINWASLFFGTGAIFIFYLLVQLIFDSFKKGANHPLSAYSAAAAGFLLGFSQIFWSQSVTAEVYALMMFLMAAILYVFFLLEKYKTPGLFYGLFFLLGLGIGHHELLAMMVLPIVLFFLLDFKKFNLPRFFLLKSFLAFFLGFLPFLYLPVAARFAPALNWGNPANLKNFFIHALRLSYPSFFQGGYNLAKFGQQFLFGSWLLFNQFSYFSLFGLLGGVFLAKKNLKYFWFLIFLFFSFFFGIIFAINFGITLQTLEIVKVFYLPCFFIWAIFMALGFGAAFESLEKKFRPGARSRVLQALPAIFLVLVFGFQLGRNFYRGDKSRYFLAANCGQRLLGSCPPNTVLVTKGDNIIFPVFYLKNILKLRPDIDLLEATESGRHLSRIPEYLKEVKSFKDFKKICLKLKKSLGYNFNIFDGPQILRPHGLVYLDADFSLPRKDAFKIFDKKLLNFSGVPDYFGREILADIYSKLGDNLLFQGRPQEALRAYQTGSAIGYDQLLAHSYFWRRFKDLGELEKARNEEKIIQRISADAFQIIKIAVK